MVHVQEGDDVQPVIAGQVEIEQGDIDRVELDRLTRRFDGTSRGDDGDLLVQIEHEDEGFWKDVWSSTTSNRIMAPPQAGN
ncbi:MAG: hypothetical protein R2845_08825 [Thermomicrobiales bacterium]